MVNNMMVNDENQSISITDLDVRRKGEIKYVL